MDSARCTESNRGSTNRSSHQCGKRHGIFKDKGWHYHASYQLLRLPILKELATQHGIPHFVTSAKYGTGIEELFFYIARSLKDRWAHYLALTLSINRSSSHPSARYGSMQKQLNRPRQFHQHLLNQTMPRMYSHPLPKCSNKSMGF